MKRCAEDCRGFLPTPLSSSTNRTHRAVYSERLHRALQRSVNWNRSYTVRNRLSNDGQEALGLRCWSRHSGPVPTWQPKELRLLDGAPRKLDIHFPGKENFASSGGSNDQIFGALASTGSAVRIVLPGGCVAQHARSRPTLAASPVRGGGDIFRLSRSARN